MLQLSTKAVARLTVLAEHLEHVREHKFNYEKWYHFTGVGDAIEQLNDASCDTTGCALGWAASIWPDDWKVVDSDSGFFIPVLKDCGDDTWPCSSAVRFFDITSRQAEFLFVPDMDEVDFGPKDVAVKIRDFINSNGATI